MYKTGNSVNPEKFEIKNLKKEVELNTQIKQFIEDYNTPYTYEWIKDLEDYLNHELEGFKTIFYERTENDEGYISDESNLPAYEGYGNKAEAKIYRLIKKGIRNGILNINNIYPQNPYGEMKFPDYIMDDIYMDSKAVKCDKLKNGLYSAHYSNSLADRSEIISMADNFFNFNKLDQKTSALIIYTYYIPEDEHIRTLKIKVVPYLFCIGTYKDNKGFAIKWRDKKTGEIKNNAVINKLDIQPYNNYLINIKEALEYETGKCIPWTVSTVS